MSFADHIRACNNFDRSRVVPLLAGGLRIGWLRHDNAAALARFDSVFAVEPRQVRLVVEGDADTVSAAVDEVVEALVVEKSVPKWRNETFDVMPRWGDPPICTSIVSTVPDTALCHFCGTRPRLANNSRTRGITPGSAAAWTEKQTATKGASLAATGAAPSSTDDIGQTLGRMMANQHGPSPFRAREANSPAAGAMCRPGHPLNVSRAAARVNPRIPGAASERIETRRGPVPG